MKISVLTPCFNAARSIEKAVESVLAQDYPDFEHIVIDGGSSDGTVEILRKFTHLNWLSEKDRGQSDAMNKALRMASGEVLVFLNADDYFHPGAFSAVRLMFARSPDSNIVVGGFDIYDGLKVTTYYPKLSAQSLILEQGHWPYNPVSYFIRRELQALVGLYPENDHFTMDYWWLLRSLKFARPSYVEDVLGVFNNCGGNKTSDLIQADRRCRQTLVRFLATFSGLRYTLPWGKHRARRVAYRIQRKAMQLFGIEKQ